MTAFQNLPFLRRVRPGVSGLDVRDRLLTHPKLDSDVLLENAGSLQEFTNLTDVRPCQRRKTVVFPSVALMIANSVFAHVLGSCTPADVFRPVVIQFPPRAVKSFLSLWTRADESFEDQVVYPGIAPAPGVSVVQVDLVVAVRPQVGLKKLASANAFDRPASYRAHAAVVADFVQALPIEDGLPGFVHALSNNAPREVYS